MQKGCKNVVKEFLTGGESAVAPDPEAWQGVGPVRLPVALSIASHTPIMFISVELKE